MGGWLKYISLAPLLERTEICQNSIKLQKNIAKMNFCQKKTAGFFTRIQKCPGDSNAKNLPLKSICRISY